MLKAANDSVDTWKERCRILEWDRDGWGEKTRELEKNPYRSTFQKRCQDVKTLNDGETFELCRACTERLPSSSRQLLIVTNFFLTSTIHLIT